MKNYIKNAAWIFFEKLLRVVVTFFLFVLMSRMLGPSDTGLLSFSQSLVAMLLCITGLGIDGILIKEFSSKKYTDVRLYSTAMLSKFFITGVVILFSCIITLLVNAPNEAKVIFLLSLIGLIFQSQNTFYSYFQARSLAKSATKYSLYSLLISSLVKVYLIRSEANVFFFSLSFTFDFFISFLFLMYHMRQFGLRIKVRNFDRAILFDLIKQSYPIVISSLIVVLYTRLDQFMIAKMLTTDDLGIFSVAVRISEAYSFVPAAIATSFFPLLVNDKSTQNIKLYFDLVFFSAFFTGVTLLIISYFYIDDIFGMEFVGTKSVLVITIFSTMFSSLGGACTNYLITINLTYMRLVRAVIGLAINFILNLMFIPRYGIIGAAYASLISQIFAAVVGNVLNRKTMPCFFYQTRSIMTLGLIGTINFCFKLIKGRGYE